MIMILFTILLWIIILDNLLLGIFLLIKAFQIKFINLYSMGIGFVLFFVGLFGNFVLGYGYFFEELFVFIGYFLIAFFTYLTFHRRKVDYKARLLLYLSLVFMFTRIFLGLLVEINLNPVTRYSELIIINCCLFLVFYWLGWSSLSAYKRLRNINVAPWLKTRYKAISIVSFLWPFHALLGLFLPWNTEFGDPSDIISLIHFSITVILSLIFIIGMIIAWIIPEYLKNYINSKKGYEPPDDKELSEDDLMKLIKSQLP
ncbi:MAG: hypothetical protein ACFFA3_01170 [Promethearchaeota archaeon]